jgi:serine/threonine-protein kinase RsbW
MEVEDRQQKRYALAHPSAVASVRRSLNNDLADAGADPSAAFDCLVAVTEACANALLHGPDDAPAQVAWSIERSTARILVENYARARTPRREGSHRGGGEAQEGGRGAAEPRAGGFGLRLMRELMDRVDITIEEGGTRVELAKRIR